MSAVSVSVINRAVEFPEALRWAIVRLLP